MGQKEKKGQDVEEFCEMLSSGHDTVSKSINSEELWLLAHSLQEVKPVNILDGQERGLGAPLIGEQQLATYCCSERGSHFVRRHCYSQMAHALMDGPTKMCMKALIGLSGLVKEKIT